MQCGGITVLEYVLVNFPVNIFFPVSLSSLAPPPFQAGPYPGYVWTRFTISDVTVNANWDGSGVFLDGETEDYLLELSDTASILHKVPGFGMIPVKVVPNPVDQTSGIEFILLQEGSVRAELVNMQGKIVETTKEEPMSRGKHLIPLHELRKKGVVLENGVYLVRLFFNNQPVGFAKAVVVE